VYADPALKGRFTQKDLGMVYSRDILGEPGALNVTAPRLLEDAEGEDREPNEREKDRTLEDLKFIPGDYLLVAVLLPKNVTMPNELSIKGSGGGWKSAPVGRGTDGTWGGPGSSTAPRGSEGHWRGGDSKRPPPGSRRGPRNDSVQEKDLDRDTRVPPPRRRDSSLPPPSQRGGRGRGGRDRRSRSRTRSPKRYYD